MINIKRCLSVCLLLTTAAASKAQQTAPVTLKELLKQVLNQRAAAV